MCFACRVSSAYIILWINIAFIKCWFKNVSRTASTRCIVACRRMSYEVNDAMLCWKKVIQFTTSESKLKKGLTNIFSWVHKHHDMIKIFPIMALNHLSIILPKWCTALSTAQKLCMSSTKTNLLDNLWLKQLAI